MRAIGYVRVSTEEQSREGVSLAAQRERVRGYAALYGLDLVDVLEDAGVSAKTLDRPGLRRAFALIDRGEADGLLIAKLDRLTRSVADWARLSADRFGPNGSQLWSVSDAIDTRTAGGRLVLNVLVTVSQWEREAIQERTRGALAHKKAMGERVGSVPYGYRVTDDGRRSKQGRAAALEPDPGFAAALARLREMAASGASLRAIARAMNDAGHPTASGRPWSHSTVGHLLDTKGRAHAPEAG